MCRLFGFRSVIQSQVHRSLVEADNALWNLSERHPDGWGVAYYVDGTPHLTRSALTALRDRVFQRVSGVVASETVVAHVRKATQGTISVLNCHPFQHGRWVFAHNGDIPTFSENRSELVSKVDPRLRRFIFGDTDSEVFFFLVLSALARLRPLSQPFAAEEVIEAVRTTTAMIRQICDEQVRDACHTKRSLLTCLITDGFVMVGAHGGKELFASTYKRRCPERGTCASFGPSCERPSADGTVNHLVFASEPLGGHNVFEPMREGEVLAIDGAMRLHGVVQSLMAKSA
jgi:predicted glutamine amidotransferase